MSDVDQTLTCIDCYRQFLFEAGEARYYAARNFATPRRCQDCRPLARIRHAREGDAVVPPRRDRLTYHG